jgi:hypothetical protein
MQKGLVAKLNRRINEEVGNIGRRNLVNIMLWNRVGRKMERIKQKRNKKTKR